MAFEQIMLGFNPPYQLMWFLKFGLNSQGLVAMGLFDRSQRNKVDQLRSKKDIKGLVELLGTTQGIDFLETRKQAASALKNMKGPVVFYLIEGLHQSDINIRLGCASLLGQIGGAEAYESLIKLLDDTDERIRATAFGALSKIHNDMIIPAILNTLPTLGMQGKGHVIKLMGLTGDPRAVEILLEMLPKSTREHKKSIIQSLGEIGEPKAIPALIEELEKSDCPDLAAHALGQIGNPMAVDALINALDDPVQHWDSFQKKVNVITALGIIKDERALTSLISLLGDNSGGWNPASNLTDDPHDVEPLLSSFGTVAGAAAAALGKIGDKRAIEPLIQVLNSGGTDARAQAIRALAALGDESVLEVLTQVIKQDQDPRVRNAARSALVALGEK